MFHDSFALLHSLEFLVLRHHLGEVGLLFCNPTLEFSGIYGGIDHPSTSTIWNGRVEDMLLAIVWLLAFSVVQSLSDRWLV
jgi:hypothetical protein